ncbi:hypothetical protein B0H14DRAFT_2617118 [Mycena olivaceomarginata]|nr:hypothetical protein B0H14DRAFT_2617118 [Mycena olivaceomarginata]
MKLEREKDTHRPPRWFTTRSRRDWTFRIYLSNERTRRGGDKEAEARAYPGAQPTTTRPSTTAKTVKKKKAVVFIDTDDDDARDEDEPLSKKKPVDFSCPRKAVKTVRCETEEDSDKEDDADQNVDADYIDDVDMHESESDLELLVNRPTKTPVKTPKTFLGDIMDISEPPQNDKNKLINAYRRVDLWENPACKGLRPERESVVGALKGIVTTPDLGSGRGAGCRDRAREKSDNLFEDGVGDREALLAFSVAVEPSNSPDNTFQHLGSELFRGISEVGVKRLQGADIALDGLAADSRGGGKRSMRGADPGVQHRKLKPQAALRWTSLTKPGAVSKEA